MTRPLQVFGYDDAPHGHAEVTLEDVRVPVSNVLGDEGDRQVRLDAHVDRGGGHLDQAAEVPVLEVEALSVHFDRGVPGTSQTIRVSVLKEPPTDTRRVTDVDLLI